MSKLYVNIADTPESQSKGLMFVKDMPRDHGMLFSFSQIQPLKFWGENTYLPLDIAFVDKEGIVREISKIHPLSKKVVGCSVPCKYAIETNDGFFSENNIEVGDKIFINKEDDKNVITFASKRRILSNSKRNAKVRRLYAQIMGEDVVNDVNYQENPQNQDVTNDEWALPTLKTDELWKYLEDDIEAEPEEIKVEPPEKETPIPQEPQPLPETEFEYPTFNNFFDAEEWAEQNHEVVRISYTTKKGKGIVRDVEPHGTFHSESTGNQILVTFDKTVGDIRAFILNNVKSFAFTGERFDPKFKLA